MSDNTDTCDDKHEHESESESTSESDESEDVRETVSGTPGFTAAAEENDTETEDGGEGNDPLDLAVTVSFARERLEELINEADTNLSVEERDAVLQIIAERDAALREYIDEQLAAIEPEPEPEPDESASPPLTEERVKELINEVLKSGGYGEGGYGDGTYGGGGGTDEETEALKRQLRAMLERLNASLRDLEKSLSRVVGPSPARLVSNSHSTAGWGVHFETNYPIRLLTTTVVANKSGYINFEVHSYDAVEGKSTGVVDSTEVGISGAGTHEIDLDLHVPGTGNYVLTRDLKSSPPSEKRVALRRTESDYEGWASDSGDGLTFHGGADADGRWSDNKLWYYFGDLHIRDAIDESQ